MPPSSAKPKYQGQLSWLQSKLLWFTHHRRVMIVILTVAMAQGLSTITELSQSYLFKDNYRLSPAEVNGVLGLISIPWLIKPIWGYLSDNYPLLGYRRRSYLFIMGILIGFGLISLGTWSESMKTGLIILIMNSLGFAFNNVIGEALIVEAAQKFGQKKEVTDEDKQQEASKNVSLFYGTKNIGILISAYFSGLLLEYVDKTTVFKMAAILPLIVTLISNVLPEQRISLQDQINNDAQERDSTHSQEENQTLLDQDDSIEVRMPLNIENLNENKKKKKTKKPKKPLIEKDNYEKIKDFVSMPQIYKPLGFLFIFIITPSAGSAMFFFYTNELGFPPEFMGKLKLVNSAANIFGIYIFNKFLRNVPFKKILTVSTIICFFLGLSQILLVTRYNQKLGIPDKFFCIGDSLIIQVFAEINWMPILVLACRICPKNIEGTMYALLMAVFNLGGTLSQQVGAIFVSLLGITETNFDNLWIMILISCTFLVLPLPLLNHIQVDEALTTTQVAGATDDQHENEEDKEELHNLSIDSIEVQFEQKEAQNRDAIKL